MSSSGLAGRRVVLTRPAAQAGPLAALIRAAGADPQLFPTLEILDVADSQPLDALLDRLETFDLAVFVSANAVNRGLALVRSRRSWPPGLRVATVGSGSERELHRHGFAAVIVPAQGFDSEALLDLPEMKQVAGKRILIFRGQGGRELLAQTLAARGAAVEYAECYRRGRPKADAAALIDSWEQGRLDAFTATSSEALSNLGEMLGERGRQCLQSTPLFVPHQRIAAAARAMGIKTVELTGPGDAGLVAGIGAFFAKVKV
jgi:uroporphyrinogen-III synthase